MIHWEPVKGEINTYRMVADGLTMIVSPIPPKGGFVVRSTELGGNWSADHRAKNHPSGFRWEVWAGDRRLVTNRIGHGSGASAEEAKRRAQAFVSSWAKAIYLSMEGVRL